MIYSILLGLIGTGLGFYIGNKVRINALSKNADSIEIKIKERLELAEKEAKELVKEADSKAQNIIERAKEEEKEVKANLLKNEDRLIKKEEALEKDIASFKEQSELLKADLLNIEEKKKEQANILAEAKLKLEKIAGITQKEALEKIFDDATKENKEVVLSLVRKLESEKQEEVEKKGLDIITTAIQRYARGHVADITTTALTLPSEDLKGKIIGREGRNIRTLERLTGAEFIIDEAPDTILISSFDPVRREIAKMTLEKLIQDGRIQPAKIEEKIQEAEQELEKRIQKIGDDASYEAGILDFPKEINYLLGKLYFRTSYGQNVLNHSIEVAYISAMIAEELGVKVDIARKGGMLHDIGKAIDHEVAGSHIELGIKLLKKYNIDERIIQAMMSHHEDYPFASPEAYIVTAADILSAARPGARRGTLEQYVKRLEELERIAKEFHGVKNSYAIAAGRELRIFVVPETIDDFGAVQMAKDIASKIESEMKYPGDIKVTVIREVRSVEFAR